MAVNMFGEGGDFVTSQIWGCGKGALGQAAGGLCTSWSNVTGSSLLASTALVLLPRCAASSTLCPARPACKATLPAP